MTTDDEPLIERVASAYRGRDGFGRIQESPAFADLDEPARELAYAAAVQLRSLEAALDPDGLSTTGKLVLERILGASRPSGS